MLPIANFRNAFDIRALVLKTGTGNTGDWQHSPASLRQSDLNRLCKQSLHPYLPRLSHVTNASLPVLPNPCPSITKRIRQYRKMKTLNSRFNRRRRISLTSRDNTPIPGHQLSAASAVPHLPNSPQAKSLSQNNSRLSLSLATDVPPQPHSRRS